MPQDGPNKYCASQPTRIDQLGKKKLNNEVADSSDFDQTTHGSGENPPLAEIASEYLGSQTQAFVSEKIGPYRTVAVLGSGGMGVVYLAHQQAPIQRDVALKVIQAWRNSKEVIARFNAERQALAMMNHPSIAKVLDAGITQQRLPFFVMELIDGKPLTDCCDAQQLTVEQRLELFRDICFGVAHAHQKGIIHRDLKPSNILVAKEGGKLVPKIIDFGLAKATGQNLLSDQTKVTAPGFVLGTVQYMSPEQTKSQLSDIDTRTDIYSLGVILYELLTGKTPLEHRKLESKDTLAVLGSIQSDEPERMSVCLERLGDGIVEVSGKRRTSPAGLRQLIKSDLEWIVMKALDSDRKQRYSSATEFANDVVHFLTKQPVLARQPSARYQAKKFIQRNRLILAVVSLIAVTLVAATITSAVFAVRANMARVEATAASERSKQNQQRALQAIGLVQEFVLEDPVWKTNNPARAALIDILAREYEFWASEENALEEDVPMLVSSVLRLAALEREVGRYDESDALARRAIQLLSEQGATGDTSYELAMAEAEALVVDVGVARDGIDVIQDSIQSVRDRLSKLNPEGFDSSQAETFCRIRGMLYGYYFSKKSKQTRGVGAETLYWCQRFVEKFPKNLELRYLEASCRNQVTLATYKQYALPNEVKSNIENTPSEYAKAIETLQSLIDMRYRPLDCRRRIAAIVSNRGLFLTNRYRVGSASEQEVRENYASGLRAAKELVEEVPENLSFKQGYALLLLNKAEALIYFQQLEEEQAALEEAGAIFSELVDAMGFAGEQAELFMLCKMRFASNQYRQGDVQRASEVAFELYELGGDFSPQKSLNTMIAYALMLEHPNVAEKDRDAIRERCNVAFRHWCKQKFMPTSEYQRDIIQSDPLFAYYRTEPKFRDDLKRAGLRSDAP